MPRRLKRACRYPGCPDTTTDKTGYCDRHQKTEGRWSKKQRKHGTDRQRGYGSEWRVIRVVALKRDNYLCQSCLSRGIATPASHVDHIVNKDSDGTDDLDNLQSLCKRCHATKTAREGAVAANRRMGRGG